MKKEHWVPITGYEGWYEVSDQGRVRSIDRTVVFKDGSGSRDYVGKILKFRYHNGYAMVNLNKNKKMKEYYVHRLVIENFTLHPRKKRWVNHKNGIKSDNRLENLEWCTPSENNEHAVKHGLRNDNIDGILKHNIEMRKGVVAIKHGKILYKAECSRDLAEKLLKKKLLSDVTPETAGRSIRKAANSGREYHGMYFQFINN